MDLLSKGFKLITGRKSPVFPGTRKIFQMNSFEQGVTLLIAPLDSSLITSISMSTFSLSPKGGSFGGVDCSGNEITQDLRVTREFMPVVKVMLLITSISIGLGGVCT